MENLKSEKEQLARLEQLRREKKYKEFFSAAEEAAMAFPDSYPVKFLYAEVLSETKQVEEAENVLKDLLFTYPDNINLLLELGKVTFNLEKNDEAAEYFNKILFLDPFNDQAKTLLVKIEKSKKDTPAGEVEAAEEEEEKPLNFITYTKEKEKVRQEEFVMPEVPAEEAPEKRSEIDTTPFTAATKPEDELDILEKKPDFDTKKVVFDIPSSVGSPEQPAAAPPPLPADLQPGEKEPDIEFDIPSLDEPAPPSFGQSPVPAESRAEAEIPGIDIEFDIPSLDEPGQPPAEPPPLPVDIQPGKEELEMGFDIPSLGEPVQPPPIPEAPAQKPGAYTKEVAAVKPPEEAGEKSGQDAVVSGREAEPADSEAAADTIVEMEAPQMPGVEQGPPIPPPGLEDDMPAVREKEAEFEYEIPAQRPAADEVGEFEIPSSLEDSQDDIRVEYEIPAREPLTTVDEVEKFEIPPAREPLTAVDEAEEFEIPPAQPSETADREEIDIPPIGETDREHIEIGETGSPGEKVEDGGNQQEEGEFMTESAAELYLSQGLIDDALTIYEKLYQARKEERYLVKIKQISGKRITRKKIQALTRLLNLIEKKGENRV